MTVSPVETTPSALASAGPADPAAEYERHKTQIALAEKRYKALQADRPDLGDIDACERHRALEGDARQAVLDARAAAGKFLREHPHPIPGFATAGAMAAARDPIEAEGAGCDRMALADQPPENYRPAGPAPGEEDRYLAEAMGAGAVEEELDDWHEAGNAHIAAQDGAPAAGPGCSAASEGIQGDRAPASDKAALAAGDRIVGERAEYERLRGHQAEAAARMRGLQRDVATAERDSRHGAEVFARLQLAQEEYEAAFNTADAFLTEHPDALPVYAAAQCHGLFGFRP
ncbi:MAG: hypothetical protein ACRDRJ_28725 [Streptosporangiaceae bacterium]